MRHPELDPEALPPDGIGQREPVAVAVSEAEAPVGAGEAQGASVVEEFGFRKPLAEPAQDGRLDAGAAKTSRSIAAILRLAVIEWLDRLDENTNNR